MRYISSILTIILVVISTSCVTIDDAAEPEAYSRDMPVEDIVRIATSVGGERLQEAKVLFVETKRVPELRKYLEPKLLADFKSMDTVKLTNYASLYQFAYKKWNLSLISRYLRHPDSEVAKVGWLMASRRPSPQMKRMIDSEINAFLLANQEDRLLLPEMAKAVRVNEVSSVQSLLELGLMVQGGDEFAKTLAELHGDEAAYAFMSYLAKASIDDLRQINQTTINIYTSLVILKYFVVTPIPLGHPALGHLYLYAVSRNPALSELGQTVLDTQYPGFKEVLVHALSMQPIEVQVSFVERIRQKPTANLKLLLSDLKALTRFEQVVEEINSISRF